MFRQEIKKRSRGDQEEEFKDTDKQKEKSRIMPINRKLPICYCIVPSHAAKNKLLPVRIWTEDL